MTMALSSTVEFNSTASAHETETVPTHAWTFQGFHHSLIVRS